AGRSEEGGAVFGAGGGESAPGALHAWVGGFARELGLGDEAVEDDPLLPQEGARDLLRRTGLGEEMVGFEGVLVGETLALVGELEHGLEVAELDLQAAFRRVQRPGGVARGESGEAKAVEPLLAVGMVLA